MDGVGTREKKTSIICAACRLERKQFEREWNQRGGIDDSYSAVRNYISVLLMRMLDDVMHFNCDGLAKTTMTATMAAAHVE